jgi:SanA protein
MKIFLLGLGLSIFLLSSILSNWFRRRADSRLLRSLDQIPEKALIVVLGCKPRGPSGRLNLYFIGRVASAAAAYHHRHHGHHGSDHQILCSGRILDGVNEATELATALEAAAVPPSAIVLDSDSDRTIDSIDHVTSHYGDRSVVFVTQSFHLPRTLFLSRRRGLDAWGLLAKGSEPGLRGLFRERLAEFRAIFDVHLHRR